MRVERRKGRREEERGEGMKRVGGIFKQGVRGEAGKELNQWRAECKVQTRSVRADGLKRNLDFEADYLDYDLVQRAWC
jgi:hypothetical protein